MLLWNEDKNQKLMKERWISFDDISLAIQNDRILWAKNNPNYENQKVIILNIDNYAYVVPFVIQENWDWFLKTIYPSRKETKFYNLKK